MIRVHTDDHDYVDIPTAVSCEYLDLSRFEFYDADRKLVAIYPERVVRAIFLSDPGGESK